MTLSADKGYDTRGFVRDMRERNVTPHVSENLRFAAVAARWIVARRRHAGYLVGQPAQAETDRTSIRVVEDGGGMLRKTRHRGIFKVGWVFNLAAAAYNLVRMRNLAVVRSS